ncbi:hypothetical protein ABZY31_12830 [Streptomyces sp. NPDC006529]
MIDEMKELISLPLDTEEAQVVERQVDAHNSQSLDDFMETVDPRSPLPRF